jgi:hypothetical protein
MSSWMATPVPVGVGADVGERLDAQRQDLALGVERHLGARLDVAAVRARKKFFAAVGHPLHGAINLQRGEGDRNVLGIGAGLHAEAAAHVAHHHAHLFLGQADGRADGIANARGHLRAHANGEAAGFCIARGEHGARLDGQGDHALVVHVERHDMGRLGEGGGGVVAGAVAHFGGHVARGLLAEQGRAVGGGAHQVDHHRQIFVVDHDGFRRVARLLHGVGHHRRHRLADETGAFLGQGMARRACAVAAVGALEARGAGHGLDASLGHVGACDHAQHARHRSGGARVDRTDACVGVGGTKENEVCLFRQRDVVGVSAGAGQKAFVLEAAHRLAAAEAEGIGFSGQRGPLVLIPAQSSLAWRIRRGTANGS